MHHSLTLGNGAFFILISLGGVLSQMAPYTAAAHIETLSSSRRERRCQMWQEADDGVLPVRLGDLLSQMAPYTAAVCLT